MKRKITGFSVAQLLIVIGVMMLVTAITLPNLTDYVKNLQLKNSTKEVMAKLKLAQQYALTEQVKYALRFVPLNSSYSLIKMGEPETTIDSYEMSSNVYLSSISGLQNNEAVYNAGGAVDYQGEIYLTHADTGVQTLINVKPAGYVTWQIYQEP